MTKLRIAYMLPELSPCGGIRICIEHCNRLAALGHSVSIVTPNTSAKPKWIDCQVPILPMFAATYMKWDIAVATAHQTVQAAIVLKPKRKFWFVQMMEYEFQDKDTYAYQAAKLDYVLAKSKGFEAITINTWLQDTLLGSFGIESTVIKNGINFDDFYPDCDKESYILLEGDNRNPAKDTKMIAWEAAYMLRKEFGVPIWAFAAVAVPWENDVDFFVKKPIPRQIRRMYSGASFLLKASHYEGRACAPVEAMACGTPSVRGIDKGDPDLVNLDRASEFCIRTSYDVKELIAGGSALLKDPTRLRNMSENALQRAKAELQWDPIIARLEEQYTC